MRRKMHPNSLASWRDLNPMGREYKICLLLSHSIQPLTDRSIAERLGSGDMNYARPSITRLIRSGRIKEVGTTKCPCTGKTVRVVRLATDEERQEFVPRTERHNRRFEMLQEIVHADSQRWKRIMEQEYRGSKPLGVKEAEEAMSHRTELLRRYADAK